MKKSNKNVWNGLFLLLLFLLTVYGVLRGESITEIWNDLKRARTEYILLGCICVILYIWGESVVIHYMLHSFAVPVRRWKCFLFSSVGFFFSCITPSASGGQPMQMYYMKKEKIPLQISSVVLLVVTITYKLVLVVIGIGLRFFRHDFLQQYLEGAMPVFYLGLWLNVACIAFLLLLVFHPALAGTIVKKGVRILERLHLTKHREKKDRQAEDSMELYHATAGYLKNHKKIIFNVFVLTFVQRMLLFSVTYLVYRSFGLNGSAMLDVIWLQAAISVSVDMLPLPGGMGISETLFLMIFDPVFGFDYVVPGLILSRGIGYYAQLLGSAVMTVTAHLTLGKNLNLQKREKREHDRFL